MVNRVCRCLLWTAMVVGVLALPTVPVAAAGWLPAVNVSSSIESSEPSDYPFADVAVTESGDAVATWVRRGDGLDRIEAATRRLGGGWTTTTAVSSPSESAGSVQVVVDAAGNATAVWLGLRPENRQVIRISTRAANGAWSTPEALTDLDGFVYEPDIAVAPDGTVTVVWCEEIATSHGVVRTATRTPGGNWSEPVTLSDPSHSVEQSQVAVDAQGTTTALWLWLTPGRSTGVVQSRTRPATGPWNDDTTDVSGPDGLVSVVRLAVDDLGGATALWWRYDIPAPSGFKTFVQSAQRVESDWQEPLTISTPGVAVDEPAVVVDRHGTATAVWNELTSSVRTLRARVRTPDGTWGDPRVLSTSDGFGPGDGNVGFAPDHDGNVTIIWSSFMYLTMPNWSMLTRSTQRTTDGAWGSSLDLSPTGAITLMPRLAVDRHGYVTVVWGAMSGTRNLVRSRVFDPVAPTIHDLVVPDTATVGEPVTASVAADDTWSEVTVRWAFGDGGDGVTGSTPRHVYASPGERTITVTATDAAGNVAERTRTILVSPAADSGGPGDPGDPGGPGDRRDPGSPDDRGPGEGGEPRPDPVAPRLSQFRQSASRWRVRKARGSRTPVGTSFGFRLDRNAIVRLRFEQLVSGRRSGKRCVKATKANRTKRACHRIQKRGTLTATGRAGTNRIAFRGKLVGRTLKPGRYRVQITATADGKSSKAVTMTFTIAR